MIRERLGCFAVEAFFVGDHSFALHYLQKLTPLTSLDRASSLLSKVIREFLLVGSGGFLVLVLAQGQQPPSIRVGHEGRMRPIPYAFVTLSGSREGK